MAQQSSSAQLNSTWGKFATKTAAEKAQTKLQEAGIAPDKITLETENFALPIKLEATQAIANIKTGAIAGAVLGFLVGLSISLIVTDFAHQGLASFKNFQTINYFAPLIGAIVGAIGMSLIAGASSANIPKDETSLDNISESKRYLIVVKGTAAETSLATEIVTQEGGLVEEADRQRRSIV